MLIFVIKITVSLCGIWVAIAVRICRLVMWITQKTSANKSKKSSNRPWPLTMWSGPVCLAQYWRSGKQKNLPCFPAFISACDHLQRPVMLVEVLQKFRWTKLNEWVNEVRSRMLEVTVSTVELSHGYAVVVQANIECKDSWCQSLIVEFTETWNVIALTQELFLLELTDYNTTLWNWKLIVNNYC